MAMNNEVKTDTKKKEKENVKKDVEQTQDVVSQTSGGMGNSDGGDRGMAKETEEVTYYTLAEAYNLMLRGNEFRFKEWKKSIPYVARVERGRTTIGLKVIGSNRPDKSFRPSQAEAVKKLWYKIN